MDEVAWATGRDIRFVPISRRDFIAALEAESVPGDYVSLLDYLFVTVLDGRNEHIGDGVQRALGRERRDFRDYAMAAARTGAWAAPASLAV